MDVVKLYLAVANALCEQTAYRGITVIFDEFSKFLEANLDKSKMLNFVDSLYDHFGMVIGPEQYKAEMKRSSVAEVGDLSFLETNLDAFAQKLKDCGFLRDLSDATSIVENPYECEEVNE